MAVRPPASAYHRRGPLSSFHGPLGLMVVAGVCFLVANLHLHGFHRPSSLVSRAVESVGDGQGGGGGGFPPHPVGWTLDQLQLISSHKSPMFKLPNLRNCTLITGMRVKYYDDEAFQDFMRSQWPQYYLEFRALYNIAAKSDMFRYAVVSTNGGVWIDADISCISSPRDLWSMRTLMSLLPGSDYFVCFTSAGQPTCGPRNSFHAKDASPAQVRALLESDPNIRVRGFVGIEVACDDQVSLIGVHLPILFSRLLKFSVRSAAGGCLLEGDGRHCERFICCPLSVTPSPLMPASLLYPRSYRACSCRRQARTGRPRGSGLGPWTRLIVVD
jgi:hypothetical protein